MKYITISLVSFLLFTGSAHAELDKPKSTLMMAEAKVSVPEVNTNGNLSLPRGKNPIKNNAVVANVTPSKTTLKEHQLDKRKLLRCWQYGRLIVAENGFQAPGASGQVMLTRGAERMTGFDFGETFCLYLGG